MSCKSKSHIFCIEMIKSKNYINNNGSHPMINTFISWNAIVFNKKNIGNDQWSFCSDDKKILKEAKKQWKDLKVFNDYIIILE